MKCQQFPLETWDQFANASFVVFNVIIVQHINLLSLEAYKWIILRN